MKIEFGIEKLRELIIKQINNLFFLDDFEIKIIKLSFDEVLLRVEKCFSANPNKYYHKNDEVYFNPYHTGQYCIFLYFMSNTIFRNTNNTILCDKIYYLNKVFNSCDLFYEVNLPDIFMLDHPVGAVMGRAKYSNFLNFSQGCTIGGNKGKYPIIGEKVVMMSDSKIIGNSIIGNNVIISANTYIKDENVPDNCIVFGNTPNLIFKVNNLF